MEPGEHCRRHTAHLIVVIQLALLTFSPRCLCQTTEATPRNQGHHVVSRLLTKTDPEMGFVNLHISQYEVTSLKAITAKWQIMAPPPIQPGDNEAIVLRVRIQNDGTLAAGTPTVEFNSGKKELGEAAVAAVRLAAPFKALPDQLPQLEFGVYLDNEIRPSSLGLDALKKLSTTSPSSKK